MRGERRSAQASHHQRGGTEQQDLKHHGQTHGEPEPEQFLQLRPIRP